MAYAEKRGKYWRVRYLTADGRYSSTSVDDAGDRFASKASALEWGRDKEAAIRRGLDDESAPSVAEAARRARKREGITLGEWAQQWFPRQDVAPSTQAVYRNYLEGHILPHAPEEGGPIWNDTLILDITEDQVRDWERAMEAAGVPLTSRTKYRAMLFSMLEDATDQGLIHRNPVARKRGRGRKSGRVSRGRRAPEKPTVDPLGALLIAERMALLAGRDDEFTLGVTAAWTGMRLGELIGLERAYVRSERLRVEWQLHELSGQWYRQPPKDDSYRDLDLPPFLAALLNEHLKQRTPQPTDRCDCLKPDSPAPPHRGGLHVFDGGGSGGATIANVADAAGVSTGTASGVISGRAMATEETRTRVEQAAARLRFTGARRAAAAPHLRRGRFEQRLFSPAASGWYAKKGPQEARAVPVTAGPWPGVPLWGRGAAERATGEWEPIKMGLTPHGLRHSHRTWMTEDGVPEVLAHERLGHELAGIGAVYTHVTERMRNELKAALTARWENALAERATLAPRSAVPVLDSLLAPHRGESVEDTPKIISQNSPNDTEKTVTSLRPRKQATA